MKPGRLPRERIALLADPVDVIAYSLDDMTLANLVAEYVTGLWVEFGISHVTS
jgi:hypothetical protein